MTILWKYLKPQKWLIVVALVLAGASQVLNLVNPIIFGKIIDDYALNPGNLTENALVTGVLFWLGVAVVIGARPVCKNVPGLFRTTGSTAVRDADIQRRAGAHAPPGI
jgi:ABC-type multidrug transport system fused ATPase/permease subunit